MSNNYHVNPETGEARPCSAKIQCQFGEVQHFDTVEAAREHAEVMLSETYGSGVALKKKAKKIEKSDEVLSITTMDDTNTFFSTSSVKFDEENNNVVIGLRAANRFYDQFAMFGEKGKGVEELHELYPDEIEDRDGLYPSEIATSMIVILEEERINNSLTEEDIEELRNTFLRPKKTQIATHYLKDTVSIEGDENTTFTIELDDTDGCAGDLGIDIDNYREKLEDERKEAARVENTKKQTEELKRLMNGDEPIQLSRLEYFSEKFGSHMRVEIDKSTNRGKVTVDFDSYIESRNRGYWNEEIYVGEPDNFAGTYSWKKVFHYEDDPDFDENDPDYYDWEITVDDEKLRQEAEYLISDWEESYYQSIHEDIEEVGIRNIVLHQKVYGKGYHYDEDDDRDEVDDLYDDVLSNRNIDVEIEGKETFWNVDGIKQDIIEMLDRETDPGNQ